MVEVDQKQIDEMKGLIETGDLDLAERRDTFTKIEGRPTTLDEDHLVKAIAATEDDDDELFCTNVKLMENELEAEELNEEEQENK